MYSNFWKNAHLFSCLGPSKIILQLQSCLEQSIKYKEEWHFGEFHLKNHIIHLSNTCICVLKINKMKEKFWYMQVKGKSLDIKESSFLVDY